jgi:UDP-GlcNAc:undecaprenyl-phosphate GlcNAc-1-phosphate transferase
MYIKLVNFYLLLAVAVFLTSFLVTLLILPKLSTVAAKIHLLDYPDKRKVHNKPKPLVGGLGMIIALTVTCFLFIPLANFGGFYLGLLLLTIIGFMDDYRK